MPSSTAKGAPYPVGTDAVASIDTIVQSLADWVDSRPGVASMTTTARDALTGGNLWAGRVIFNSTLSRIQMYNGTVWTDDVVAVSTAVLANLAVTTAKLADLAVTQGKLALLSVGTPQLIDSAVTSAKILDGTIATADVADAAITQPKLAVTISNPGGGATLLGFGTIRMAFGGGVASPFVPAGHAPSSTINGWGSNGNALMNSSGVISFSGGGSPSFFFIWNKP